MLKLSDGYRIKDKKEFLKKIDNFVILIVKIFFSHFEEFSIL